MCSQPRMANHPLVIRALSVVRKDYITHSLVDLCRSVHPSRKVSNQPGMWHSAARDLDTNIFAARIRLAATTTIIIIIFIRGAFLQDRAISSKNAKNLATRRCPVVRAYVTFQVAGNAYARAWPGLWDVMGKENGDLEISAEFHGAPDVTVWTN